MIITVSSFKGGVGKTTTAVHLATWLQATAPTLLVDGDGVRSATKWDKRGAGFPFKVVGHAQMIRHARDYAHVVIDTEGNPSDDDFTDLVLAADLLVIPAVPETVASDGLIHTVDKLRAMPGKHVYRVLLTMVPPRPRTDGDALRAVLHDNRVPVFAAEIPRLAAFEKAAAAGVPVGAVRDRNAPRAWASYAAVGAEIHG